MREELSDRLGLSEARVQVREGGRGSNNVSRNRKYPFVPKKRYNMPN